MKIIEFTGTAEGHDKNTLDGDYCCIIRTEKEEIEKE